MKALDKTTLEQLLPKVKQTALDSCSCLENNWFTQDLEVQAKGPHDFLTRIDLEVSEHLCLMLPKLLPDSQVLSEENKDITISSPFLWIIDPIDGTNNLIYDLPFYAVSIGLVCENQGLLGVVYLPASGELFSAAQGCGSYVENPLIRERTIKPVTLNKEKNLNRAIVMAETDPYFDRNKNPSIGLIKAVFDKCIDCRITGSAAIDMSYIASGRAHVHFCRHLNPWDYAGGTAILTEAGGIVSQWDGSPMSYKGKHTSLASNCREIHDVMLEIVRDFI